MGAGYSGLECNDSRVTNTPTTTTSLGDLPENCIALILSHLDHPSEVCKFASLNKVFHRASQSDLVWETKVPDNHQLLVRKFLLPSLGMKQVYANLCQPFRLCRGTVEVWMDKKRGGICVAASWKGMKITGIHDRRCWTLIPTFDSRFETAVYLNQIWWLEVEGQIGFEFPKGTYSLFFRLHFGRPNSDRTAQKIHGWDIKPVQFQMSSSAGQCAITHCFLQHQPGTWIHHHVGDFEVTDSTLPTNINFSMAQIDCTHTKGGLCLDSVLIFPTN